MIRLLVLFTTLLLFSCNIINKNEPKIGVIRVKAFKVVNNGNDYGSLSSKVSHVWVSYGGKSLGVYELPAEIPLLEGQKLPLILAGGVKKNGISESIVDYPMYNALFDTITVTENSVKDYDTISVEYLQGAQMKFHENFELGNNFYEDMDGNTETNVFPVANANIFEGNKSGYIGLISETNKRIEVASNAFTLSRNKKHYLELNYKCNMVFNIGLVGNDLGQVLKLPIITISKKDSYNKIYIQLNSITDNLTDRNFKVYIFAEKPSDLPLGEIYLDNIKVLEI